MSSASSSPRRPPRSRRFFPEWWQHTLKDRVGCSGVGFHSGQPVNVRLIPAPPGHGVVFSRVDLKQLIPARFDTVVDTRLCTTIGAGEARVSTIEHLMAALAAAGVDNILIEIDGPELPILDGSSQPWLDLLDSSGIFAQNGLREVIEVLQTVRVDTEDAYVELKPCSQHLEMQFSISFDSAAIGQQTFNLIIDSDCFRHELCRARTFVLKHEVENLQGADRVLGVCLENAVIVDGDQILNPGGLRMQHEFVRHKMLDALGDLALAGGRLNARFVGHRSGHALNNRALRALFANPANWRFKPMDEVARGEARV